MADVRGYNDTDTEPRSLTANTEDNGYDPSSSVFPGQEANYLYKQLNEAIESKRLRNHIGAITLTESDMAYTNTFTSITYGTEIAVDAAFPNGKQLHVSNNSALFFFVAGILISPYDYVCLKKINGSIFQMYSPWGGMPIIANQTLNTGLNKPIGYKVYDGSTDTNFFVNLSISIPGSPANLATVTINSNVQTYLDSSGYEVGLDWARGESVTALANGQFFATSSAHTSPRSFDLTAWQVDFNGGSPQLLEGDPSTINQLKYVRLYLT